MSHYWNENGGDILNSLIIFKCMEIRRTLVIVLSFISANGMVFFLASNQIC